MGRAGGNKRTPRPVLSRAAAEPAWRRALRNEPRTPLTLCEFAALADPDCTIDSYRMVLTVIVATQAEADAFADRLRGHGFEDNGWKSETDSSPRTRMLVGVEATVMITLTAEPQQ